MTTYGITLVANIEKKIANVSGNRTSLIIANLDPATPFFIKDGGSGVSTLNGIRVPPNGQITYKIPEDNPTSSFFAIATANINLVVQEQLGQTPLPVRVV